VLEGWRSGETAKKFFSGRLGGLKQDKNGNVEPGEDLWRSKSSGKLSKEKSEGSTGFNERGVTEQEGGEFSGRGKAAKSEVVSTGPVNEKGKEKGKSCERGEGGEQGKGQKKKRRLKRKEGGGQLRSFVQKSEECKRGSVPERKNRRRGISRPKRTKEVNHRRGPA